MATVFLAHDRAGNPVAFKLLNPELGSTLGADRFRREIRVAARLQHPNILSVLDSGVATVPGAGGTSLELLWFTMPFVQGQNVWERFEKEGPFPTDEVIRIGRAVASALAYAHAQGVVHRDIKPDNVMLEDDRVLVADFGVARAVSEVHEKLTATGMVVGTPTYMSPEQASGDKEIDGRSDVFALACVLYELLSGRRPSLARRRRRRSYAASPARRGISAPWCRCPSTSRPRSSAHSPGIRRSGSRRRTISPTPWAARRPCRRPPLRAHSRAGARASGRGHG